MHLDRAQLQYLADLPLDDPKRICGVWLPMGRRGHSLTRAERAALKAAQIDVEEAIEERGGERGHLNGKRA